MRRRKQTKEQGGIGQRGPGHSEIRQSRKPLRFGWIRRFRYWWLGGRSLTRSIFRVTAAWQGVMILGGALLVCYFMAAFYTQSGEFVIRIDHNGEKGLVISDTTDFSQELITLNGTPIPEADNISIFNIDPEVMDIDGDHNGPEYLAYTFYATNIGYDPITYTYNLSIEHETKGMDEAIWVLLYHNGQHQILAKKSKTGEPELQRSEYEFPFMEDALKPEQYSYDEETGLHTLTTVPFDNARIVDMQERPALQPGEVDKFTVVIWLEGEDPECVNDILGGTIEMMMKLRY